MGLFKSKKKSSSSTAHEPYSTMKDTPWIKQGRQIAEAGGRGILDNYNNVNTFDAATRKSLDDRNNQTYKRMFDEMDRQYTNIMNKYAANNYNRFGTLNATRPQFITDEYKRDFQRQMDDAAYNKAAHYDELMDNELRRRYNTLNMYSNMYGVGQIPYQLDVSNYNVGNTNKDLAYNSRLGTNANAGGSSGFGNILGNAASGATSGYLSTGNGWGAALGGGMGILGGFI